MTEKVKIKVPDVDKREYEFFVMENKIKVFLVSDKESERSGACLATPIGSFYDPNDTLGLAHFTEHLLFMGSEKFPEEKSFHEFITTHGGTRNAYTSYNKTVYFLDLPNKFFEEGVDRFSHFFIDSLLKKDAVEREMKAVNSEYELRFTNDMRKSFALLQLTCLRDHPISRFSVGNYETLKKENIREIVKNFYEKNYSSNLMKLVLIGNKSIPELKDLAVKYFSAIKNVNLDIEKMESTRKISRPPFDTGNFRYKLIKFVPVSDISSIDLSFSISCQYKDYKKDYSRILGKLLGHEGENSLFAYLKKQELAVSLGAGTAFRWNGGQFFTITIGLPKKIEDDPKKFVKITEIIFEYIDMLKKSSAETRKKFFDEVKNVETCRFKFKEKVKQNYYCIQLAENAMKYEPEDLVYGNYYYDEYDNDVFEKILKFFTRENVMFLWGSKKFKGKTDKVEKWYKTDYKIEDYQVKENLPPNKNLGFPVENVFIPSKFEIFPNTKKQATPVKIYSTEKFEVYFKQDDQFFLPKSSFCLRIKLLSPTLSAKNCFMQTLLANLLADSLNELLYPSIEAGLHFSVKGDKEGFLMTVFGWNDTIFLLLEKILKKVFSFVPAEDRFDILKVELVRKNMNYRNIPPISQAFVNQQLVTYSSKVFDYEDFIKIGPLVTYDDILLYQKQLKSVGVSMCVVGNHVEEEVKKMVTAIEKDLEIEKKFPILDSERFYKKITKFQDGKKNVVRIKTKNEKDKNNSVIYAFQIGLRSSKRDLLLELFHMIVNADFFDSLRTKQQLGYYCSSFYVNFHNVGNYYFGVQSHEHSPEKIVVAIEKFLTDYKEEVLKLDDKKFKSSLEGLKNQYLEKHKNVPEEIKFYWGEMENEQCNFSRREEYVKICDTITKEDFIKYVMENFYKKKAISLVQVFAKEYYDLMEKEKAEGFVYFDDVLKLKLSQESYPSVYKF